MSPIYLGKHPTENHWFFFAEKEGVGRFVRYFIHGNVSYPQWIRSDQVSSILIITQVPPPEISAEVEQFLLGGITYAIVPRVRGRAERVIRTYHSSITSEEEISLESDNNVDAGGSSEEGSPSGSIPDVSTGLTIINVRHDRDELPLKRSRSKKGNLQEKLVEPPVILEVKTKRTRRTKAQMELDRIQKSPVIPIEVVVETPEVPKQKRKRRTKAEMEALRRH